MGISYKARNQEAKAMRWRLACIDGISDADARRLAIAVVKAPPIIDLPEFYQADAGARFSGIPAGLPEVDTSYVKRISIESIGLAFNATVTRGVKLNDEQRADLLARFQFARFMAATIIERAGGEPRDYATCRDILQWLEWAEKLRDLIVAYEIRLVLWAIKRLRIRKLTISEQISAGSAGLLRAIEYYDPRKSKLSTWAYLSIKQSLYKARRERWSFERADVDIQFESIDDNASFIEKMEDQTTQPDPHGLLDLKRALAEPGLLTRAEATVIRYRFGVKLDPAERDSGEWIDQAETLEAIGELLGVTRERIRQIELIALEKLRCRVLGEKLPHTPKEIDAQARRRKREAKREARRLPA